MEWSRGHTIGRGTSAMVSMAAATRSGQVFAVKSAELSQSDSLKNEQSILSTLRCPQVIGYKGCDITNENGKLFYNLFLEFATGGTLIDAIRGCGGCLNEAMIRSYARTILLGLDYLHRNGIVHCDIKGHNILVTSDGAKIADLGCARRIDEVSGADWARTTPIAGTPLYMAPEVARGEHQGFPADIWAFGCTVAEMATGKAPWVDISDPVSALYQIGFSGNAPEIPSFMSKQAKDFLSKCFKRDPKERWSASELLEHDFIIQEPNFILKEITGCSQIDTPTSVLDQGLWDSVEELETPWNSSPRSCCWVPPIERMTQLTGENGMMPNWAWEDTWVTVRSNSRNVEPEIFNSNIEECNLAYANKTIGIAWEGKIYDFAAVGIPDEPTSISGNNTCYKTSTSGSGSCSDEYASCYKILLMLPCKYTQDALCGSPHFVSAMVLLLCSLPFQLLQFCHSFLFSFSFSFFFLFILTLYFILIGKKKKKKEKNC